MVLQLVLDLLLDLLDAADEGAQLVEDVELPLRGQIVGRLQDAALRAGVALVLQIGGHALGEAAAQRAVQQVLELLHDPLVELGAVGGHHAVVDGRLDVGQQHAAQELEEGALDKAHPVDGAAAAVLLALGQHPRDDHLVGLLVQLREVHRVDLVVPAADAGGVEDELDEFAVQGAWGFLVHGVEPQGFLGGALSGRSWTGAKRMASISL